LALFGWDDHYFRLISTLFDPAFTGLILVMTWCLLMTQAQIKAGGFCLASLLITAILLTYSRASYLAFFSSASYLWLVRPKLRHTLILMAMVTLVGLIFLPKPAGEGGLITRTSTVKARQSSGAETLATFQPLDLLTGQGLFVSNQPLTYQAPFVISNHAKIPDNSLIFLVQSLGLIGAGVIIFWLNKIWWWSHHVDGGLAAGLLALLVHSQFNASLVQPFVLLFLILAIVSVAVPLKLEINLQGLLRKIAGRIFGL
jgi:hypothetical protein